MLNFVHISILHTFSSSPISLLFADKLSKYELAASDMYKRLCNDPPLLSLFNFNELTRLCCLGCCEVIVVDDGEKQETAPRKAMYITAIKRCIMIDNQLKQ